MTPGQVELLFQASQTPELTNDQKQRLTLVNPWTMSGPVAMVMQRRVAELNPVQAKQWIQDAGASMSLQAAAAQQGLAPMTTAIEAELARMNPKTDDELRKEKVASILAAGNPYGTPARIEDGRMIPASKGNLTQQHVLQMLDPKEAERQKRLAEGPQKGHSFTPREEQILRAHGYSLPGEG